jgi:hypothetical protein
MIHGFGLAWVKEALLVWSEFAKGVLHGSTWENRLTFKLWHPGHNIDHTIGVRTSFNRYVYIRIK